MSVDCTMTHLHVGREVVRRVRKELLSRKFAKLLKSKKISRLEIQTRDGTKASGGPRSEPDCLTGRS